MRTALALIALTLTLGCRTIRPDAGQQSPAAPADGFAVAPFSALARPVAGRAMRASSGDPNWDHGSNDYRELAPGGSLVIADLEGPGVITHIWMTLGMKDTKLWEGALRDIELRAYWDGETSPSVQAPVGDFFAVGNARSAAIDSAMVQVAGDPARPRGYNCYWPMPFARGARLELRNRSADKAMGKCYFHIDWLRQDAPPDALLRFHARYNQARPLPKGTDYTLADIRGEGHYVGTVFSLVNTPGAGFAEGDERFFIDGEEQPSIIGTGMEDYFGQAWGFYRKTGLYFGQQGLADGMTMYRWHVADPIPFRKSLRVTFENWGSTGGKFPFEEKDWKEFSSVAFWYQRPE